MTAFVRERLHIKKPFYGWYIVLGGAVTNAMQVAMVGIGFGVFIDIFKNTFGWSITAMAIGFSLRSLESGLLSPFTGFLQDKWGARNTCIAGSLLAGTGFFLYSRVHTLPMYYAGAALLALAQSIGGGNAYSAAIVRWFNKKRGRAIGVLNIGNGLGFSGPLFTTMLIALLGWRGALGAIAVIMVGVGIPLAFLIRERPEPYGLLPDGDDPNTEGQKTAEGGRRVRSNSGMEVKDALKTPAFYLLVVSQAFQGFAHSSWNSLQIPHFKANGFSLGAVGILLSTYGFAQVVLRPVMGWTGDHFGRRRVYLATLAFHGLGLLAFAWLSPSRLWLLPFYLIVFGLGHASQNTLGQSMVADFFGTKRFATLRGLRQSLTLPAAILAPIFSGLLYDHTGNYRLGFTILAFVSLSGLFVQSFVRRPFWDDSPEAKAAALAEQAAAEKTAADKTAAARA